jgi:hypothetical protein
MLQKAFIPYGGYFSSPFARWQGSMANENAITLGAATAKRWLEHKNWDPKIIDYLVFGITIHSSNPWILRQSLRCSVDGLPGYSRCTSQSSMYHFDHRHLAGSDRG